MAIVGPLLPHALHLGTAWLEVSKVLLAQARLLVDLDIGSAERRRHGIVRGEGREDALGSLPRATVGRGEEVKRVVRTEEVS